MGQIASEALIERLADWGVDTVFGLPVAPARRSATAPG